MKMNRRDATRITLLFFLTAPFLACYSQQLAFPGAEGFGRYASGGRGGSVYHVTNLNDSGAGSFRDAVSQSNRTVVFDVGGVINITNRIVIRKNITIAGQTAPGDGITIYGNGIALNNDSGNDIIRHIRIRMGKNGDSGKDAVSISAGQNYIFDHVSISWGRDGTLDVNGSGIDNLTFQDCIISQGINNSNHSTGGLMQSGKWSMIRSLYIDNKTRNPKARGSHEFINSVLYNWDQHGYIMGDTQGQSECNLIGNYFIYGPSSNSNTHITGTTPSFQVYAEDNWVDDDKDGTLDGTLLTNYKTATVKSSPFPHPGVINLLSASAALTHVIQHVGASISRDAVDELLINQLTSYGTRGQIINTETDNGISGNVGTVNGGTTPADTDQDGMSDAWETANGLNPNSADNNGDSDGDGFTNLEEYLDWLANNSCPPTSITPYMSVNGGSLQQLANISLAPGSTVRLSPQPATGGSWNWTGGCGLSGNTREQTLTATASCIATATLTNACGSSTSQNFTLSVSGGAGTVTIQENSTGFCQIDGTIDSNNSGYTGSGFANTTNARGSGISWQIDATTGGTHTITFRYANGGSTDRPGDLLVDGVYIGSLTFPPTSTWNSWGEAFITVAMASGVRKIELQSAGNSGLGNIDWISVTDATAHNCVESVSSIIIQEDQTGFCGLNGTIDNNNTGFTGGGFANTANAMGEGINWQINIPTSGSYTLGWRFANGASLDRPGHIIINGSAQGSSQSFVSTGSWSTWDTSSSTVALISGTNTIRLEATTPSGLANIDYLAVTGVDPIAESCAGSRSSSTEAYHESTAVIYPNPAEDVIKVHIPTSLDTYKEMRIHDISGKLIRTMKIQESNTYLDIAKLLPGTYLLTLKGSKQLSQRFIKK